MYVKTMQKNLKQKKYIYLRQDTGFGVYELRVVFMDYWRIPRRGQCTTVLVPRNI